MADIPPSAEIVIPVRQNIVPTSGKGRVEVDSWLEDSKTPQTHVKLRTNITPETWQEWINATLKLSQAQLEPTHRHTTVRKLVILRDLVAEGLVKLDHDSNMDEYSRVGLFNMNRRMHFLDKNAARILSAILVMRSNGDVSRVEEEEGKILRSLQLEGEQTKTKFETKEQIVDAFNRFDSQLAINTPDIVKAWLENGLRPKAA